MNSEFLKKYSLLFFSLLAFSVLVSLIFYNYASAGAIALTLESNAGVMKSWKLIIGIANSFVILILIVVAFAEILHIQIDTYAVKKILPSIIMAVVAANFSFLLCRIAVDLSTVAIVRFSVINDSLGNNLTDSTWIPWDMDNVGQSLFNAIITPVFTLVLLIAYAVLAFLFFIRSYVIYFLVIVSPIAIMAMVLPVTKKFFDQWLGQFLRWAFLPVPSMALLGLMGIFLTQIPNGLLRIAYSSVCLYGAIILPFQLGGPIMQKWSTLPGHAFKQLGGVGARISNYGQRRRKMYGDNDRLGNAMNSIGGFINAPYMVKTLQDKHKAYVTDLGKAESKTWVKGALGGMSGQLESMGLRHADDLANSTAMTDAQQIMAVENTIRGAINATPALRTRQQQRMVEGIDTKLGGAGNYDNPLVSDARKNDALRRYLASESQGSLATKHLGLAGLTNASDIVLAQGWAKNAIVDIRGNRTRADFERVYRGGPPPTPPGGPPPPGHLPTGAVGQTTANSAAEGEGGTGNMRPVPVVIMENRDQTIRDGMSHIAKYDAITKEILAGVQNGTVPPTNLTGLMDGTMSDDKKARAVESMVPSLQGQDPVKIAEALALLNRSSSARSGNGDYNTVMNEIKNALNNHANNSALGSTVLDHMGNNSNNTIGSYIGNEQAMKELAGSVADMHMAINNLGERPAIDHTELAKVLKESMIGLVGKNGGGNGANTSMSSLLGGTDEQAKRRFAETMGKAVATSMAKQGANMRTPAPEPQNGV
ncbi:MAG: type IV secretion system protein [Candidatus Berkelbacteria bacterium]